MSSTPRPTWPPSSPPSSLGARYRQLRFQAIHEAPLETRPAQSFVCLPRQHASALRGLTLIELLIVLLITAVLCGIAWPHFETQLQRARRSEAQSALGSLLNAQARYRSTHRRYASSLTELGWRDSSLRHYQLRVEGLTSPARGGDAGGPADPDEPFMTGFVGIAWPLTASPQVRDTSCAQLRLTLEGRQVTHAAIDASGVASTGCWPQ